MLKSKPVLQVEKGERIYQFTCEGDAPLGEIFDVIHQMQDYILQVLKAEHDKKSKEAEAFKEAEVITAA